MRSELMAIQDAAWEISGLLRRRFTENMLLRLMGRCRFINKHHKGEQILNDWVEEKGYGKNGQWFDKIGRPHVKMLLTEEGVCYLAKRASQKGHY